MKSSSGVKSRSLIQTVIPSSGCIVSVPGSFFSCFFRSLRRVNSLAPSA